jgi:hypothetical protein
VGSMIVHQLKCQYVTIAVGQTDRITRHMLNAQSQHRAMFVS